MRSIRDMIGSFSAFPSFVSPGKSNPLFVADVYLVTKGRETHSSIRQLADCMFIDNPTQLNLQHDYQSVCTEEA